jgi:hypothetical protein
MNNEMGGISVLNINSKRHRPFENFIIDRIPSLVIKKWFVEKNL